ncbi:MAG: hypothetical protein JXB04_06400 [Kiritimatiellae bacterium]|nr:hypothetical protein [Kiritimatiellia bacterium]
MRASSCFFGRLLLALAGLAVAGGLSVPAREDYREVSPAELLRNPQNFWSLGIMFRDALMEHPTGRHLRIGNTRYVEFGTKKLGTCYAVEEIVPMLESLPVGRTYLFTGTVLTRSPGMFSRTPTFHVVAQNVVESLAGEEDLTGGLLDAALKIPAGESGRSSAAVAHVFSSVHAALFAYSEENGLQFHELFAPDSAHAAKVMDIIQSVLLSAQREENITAIEILGQFVRDTLARYYTVTAPPAPEETPPEPAPEPAAREVEEPAPKPAPIALKAGTPVTIPQAQPKTPPDLDSLLEEPPAPEEPEPPEEPAPTEKIAPPGKILLDYELPVSR